MSQAADELNVVVCWHKFQKCSAPDRNGCPGHSFLVNGDQRAELERSNWRMS